MVILLVLCLLSIRYFGIISCPLCPPGCLIHRGRINSRRRRRRDDRFTGPCPLMIQCRYIKVLPPLCNSGHPNQSDQLLSCASSYPGIPGVPPTDCLPPKGSFNSRLCHWLCPFIQRNVISASCSPNSGGP